MIAFLSKVSLTSRDRLERRAGINGTPGGIRHIISHPLL